MEKGNGAEVEKEAKGGGKVEKGRREHSSTRYGEQVRLLNGLAEARSTSPLADSSPMATRVRFAKGTRSPSERATAVTGRFGRERIKRSMERMRMWEKTADEKKDNNGGG